MARQCPRCGWPTAKSKRHTCPDAAPPKDHDEFVEARRGGLEHMKQRLDAPPPSDAAPVADLVVDLARLLERRVFAPAIRIHLGPFKFWCCLIVSGCTHGGKDR